MFLWEEVRWGTPVALMKSTLHSRAGQEIHLRKIILPSKGSDENGSFLRGRNHV